jgi:hypothetical protein
MVEKKENFLRQQRTLKIQATQTIQIKQRPITIVAIKATTKVSSSFERKTKVSSSFERNKSKKILVISKIPIMQVLLNMKLGCNGFKAKYWNDY